MIIDTSAMAAILYGEPEAAFTRLIHESATSRISVANYLELSMVIEKQLGSEGMRQADALFHRAAIDIFRRSSTQWGDRKASGSSAPQYRHRDCFSVSQTCPPLERSKLRPTQHR